MPLELTFVTAEEAAKWPEGTPFISAKKRRVGPPMYSNYVRLKGPHSVGQAALREYTHFARLPDALPEVERNG